VTLKSQDNNNNNNQVAHHQINVNNLVDHHQVRQKVVSLTSSELELTNISLLCWELLRILFQKLLDISLSERVKIP